MEATTFTTKVCRKCGAKFVGRYCKPCDNARSAARYAADPKKVSERASAWNRNNPERRKEIVRKWSANNAPKIEEYRASNKDRITSYKRRYKKLQMEKISDVYVMEFFKGIQRPHIPDELVELKRIQLQIHRKLKEAKK